MAEEEFLPEVGGAEELLPWQRAVLRLHNREDVTGGPWQWRLYRVPDLEKHPAEVRVRGMMDTLMMLGEEYSLVVWRPMVSDTPEGYRLALFTWGAYLDMTSEEIYDTMNRRYAPPGTQA